MEREVSEVQVVIVKRFLKIETLRQIIKKTHQFRKQNFQADTDTAEETVIGIPDTSFLKIVKYRLIIQPGNISV